MKIFIVEDDLIIREYMDRGLKKWGYSTFLVEKFDDIVSPFKKENPDLVIMDITLPFFNGYYWCQEIRKISTVPIIFVSSNSESTDIIMGMQFGGDDYITKPIDMDVVVAKVQAILRRSYTFVKNEDSIEFCNVKLLLSEAKISYKESTISLTKTEYIIMETLFRKNGEIAKRDDIINKCWQDENFIDDNTLAVNMTRLRKKLREIELDALIQTKKGIGYFLRCCDE